MNSLIIYLLQSGFSLGALYFTYWLFLRQDTFFGLNRIYLILSVVASLIFPLMKFSFSSGEEQTYMVFLEPVIITSDSIKESLISSLSATQLLFVIYFAGASIVFIRFLYRLIQIGILVRQHGISQQFGLKVVYVPSGFTPFSFFNILFISKDISDKTQLDKIVAHERIHMQQKHSADLILLELISIIQWFNPFIWLFRNSIKNLHEFQADQGVLNSGYEKRDYQQLLLNQTFGVQLNTLSNNFNHSLIKKRFKMMTKAKTKKTALLKMVFVVPTAIMLAIIFSITTTNQVVAQTTVEEKEAFKTNKETTIEKKSSFRAIKEKETPVLSNKIPDTYVIAEEMPKFPGGEEARVKFLAENIKYPEAARKNGVEGRVFLTYIVEKNGSISGVKVLRGIGGGCDEEAMRVIKSMPNWIPGKVEGKPVRTVFNVPIQFKLDANSSDNKKDKKRPPLPYEKSEKK